MYGDDVKFERSRHSRINDGEKVVVVYILLFFS